MVVLMVVAVIMVEVQAGAGVTAAVVPMLMVVLMVMVIVVVMMLVVMVVVVAAAAVVVIVLDAMLLCDLRRLVSGGFLTPEQGEAVKPEKLAAFYRSPLGKAVERAGMCRQEFKFSVLVPAESYRPGTEGEQVLLQGVIDCWFQDEQGITVLDFKSDRLSPGQEKSRGEEYRPQLEAYARALSAILDRPVSRKVLWFFATDTAVEL